MDTPYRIDLAAMRGERLVAAYGTMAGIDPRARELEAVGQVLRALWHASCARGDDFPAEQYRGVMAWRADVRDVAALPSVDRDLRMRVDRAGPSDADWALLAEAVRSHYRTTAELPPLRIELDPPAGPRELAGAGDLLLALHRTVCTETQLGQARIIGDLHHLGSWRHLDIDAAISDAYDRFRRDLLTTQPPIESAIRQRMGSLARALDGGEAPSAGEWDEAVSLAETLRLRAQALSGAHGPVMPLDDVLFGGPDS